LRSSGLLRMRASWAWVFQSGLKTDEGATAGGARGTIMEVASRLSCRETGGCEGLRRTVLPLLCCFLYIRSRGHCSILVFFLEPINMTIKGYDSLTLLQFHFYSPWIRSVIRIIFSF
jgi:hypothetical protein